MGLWHNVLGQTDHTMPQRTPPGHLHPNGESWVTQHHPRLPGTATTQAGRQTDQQTLPTEGILPSHRSWSTVSDISEEFSRARAMAQEIHCDP